MVTLPGGILHSVTKYTTQLCSLCITAPPPVHSESLKNASTMVMPMQNSVNAPASSPLCESLKNASTMVTPTQNSITDVSSPKHLPVNLQSRHLCCKTDFNFQVQISANGTNLNGNLIHFEVKHMSTNGCFYIFFAGCGGNPFLLLKKKSPVGHKHQSASAASPHTHTQAPPAAN